MIVSEFTLMQAKLPSHMSHVMTTLPLVCFQTSIQPFTPPSYNELFQYHFKAFTGLNTRKLLSGGLFVARSCFYLLNCIKLLCCGLCPPLHECWNYCVGFRIHNSLFFGKASLRGSSFVLRCEPNAKQFSFPQINISPLRYFSKKQQTNTSFQTLFTPCPMLRSFGSSEPFFPRLGELEAYFQAPDC